MRSGDNLIFGSASAPSSRQLKRGHLVSNVNSLNNI